jgi:predicted transcriptional regulator
MRLTSMAQPHRPLVSPLDAALEYARLGLPVLPLHSVQERGEMLICTCGDSDCSHAGKHPLTTHGLNDATTKVTVIKRWFAKWPWANVGIRMGRESGLICLDTDAWKGSDAAIIDWEYEGHLLQSTLRGLTGRGGQFFFQHPGGRVISRELAPAIDIRGDDSYIVAPPSRHQSGDYYTWLYDDGAPELPRWLHRLLEPHIEEGPPPSRAIQLSATSTSATAYGTGALLGEVTALRSARNRNDRFSIAVRAVFELVAGGEIEADYAERVLRQTADEIGLDASETNRSLRHNIAKGLLRPRRAPGDLGRLPLDLQRALDVLHANTATLINVPGATRLRDRAAYDHILDIVEFKAMSFQFELAVRALAEAIGVSDTSASNALRSLRRQNAISLVCRGRDGMANTYRLAKPPTSMDEDQQEGQDLRPISRNLLHTPSTCEETYVAISAIAGEDLFRWGYANKSGSRVYAYLLDAGQKMTVAEVARMVTMRWSTTKTALQRLEGYGMVERRGKQYVAIDVDLRAKATDVGAAGIGERQREQHAADRRDFHAYLESQDEEPED